MEKNHTFIITIFYRGNQKWNQVIPENVTVFNPTFPHIIHTTSAVSVQNQQFGTNYLAK